MKRHLIIILTLVGLLILTFIGGFTGWYLEHKQVSELQAHVSELQQEEKRHAIDKSVSDQLGVIASQQKDIAEEKQEEAEKEKRRADEAFQRSEIERRKAEEAEHEARQEKEKAEQERQNAEVARHNAETSERIAKIERNKADTLRYQSLGRSLGSASLQAFSVNQLDLAQLLAYYAYHYTTQYGGVVYFPTVFQALLNASHSIQSWSKHRGMLRGIGFLPENDRRIVTVCDYGAILIHKKIVNQQKTMLKTDTLLSNRKYDFRYTYADKNGTIYAISRSGHFVVIENCDKKKTRIIPVLEKDHPFSFWVLDNKKITIVGEHSLAEIDLNLSDKNAVVEVRPMGFTIEATGHKDNQLIIFDNQHNEHVVKNIRNIETSPVPVPGKVTAFNSSRMFRSYGMEDGTIYLLKNGSNEYTKLLGHESRISQLKMTDDRLYSAGYDGKVNFWYINSEKLEPMELFSKKCWILDFTVSADLAYCWIGDKYGYITEALLEVPKMKEIIETELKQKQRDFTEDEWNYYIGKATPYQPILFRSGKEVSR